MVVCCASGHVVTFLRCSYLNYILAIFWHANIILKCYIVETLLTISWSSAKQRSYSLSATRNIIAVTPSKQCIHFFRSDLCPPMSHNLRLHIRIQLTTMQLTAFVTELTGELKELLFQGSHTYTKNRQYHSVDWIDSLWSCENVARLKDVEK